MLRTREGQISYTQRPEATQAGELNALASVYRFILNCDCHVKEEGGPVTAPNDPKGSSERTPKNASR